MNKYILGIAAATSLVVSSANASFIMYLDDESTAGIDAIVQDDTVAGMLTSIGFTTVGDVMGTEAGVVSYSGGFGDFLVNVTTGLSKPKLSGPDATIFDLVSVNVTGGSGKLKIGLTDTGFTGDHNLSFSIGGTTDGKVSSSAYLDFGDVEFGTGSMLGSTSTTSPGAFSYDSSTTYLSGVVDPYSLTLVTSIDHSGVGSKVSSFDAAVRVPEPSIIALFGLGLAGIGFAGRRRQSK